ncbi:MAG: hypothetical protein J3K34DRAFT_433472, partial [Monoraphidium minutum]
MKPRSSRTVALLALALLSLARVSSAGMPITALNHARGGSTQVSGGSRPAAAADRVQAAAADHGQFHPITAR